MFGNIHPYQTFKDSVSNEYTQFWYIDLSDVTAGYGKLPDLIAFLELFIHNSMPNTCLKYYIFTKLS